MKIIHKNSVDITGAYTEEELGRIKLGFMADTGEAGTGTVPIPENAGDITFYAGERLKFINNGNTITILDGFIGGVTIERGVTAGGDGSTPARILPAVTVVDENAMLAGIRAYRWKRPEELDYVRMRAWAVKYRGFLDRSGILSSGGVTIQKKTYSVEESIGELVNDMQDPTAKTLFIQDGVIHWHLFTEGDTAGLAISDVDGDYDYATTFPPYNPIKTTDPSDMGNDVLAFNSKGQTQRATDATSRSRHDSGGWIRHQRLLDLPDSKVASLLSHASGVVSRDKEERFTYECDIGPLTHAQVADIRKGTLINVTSEVWGLTSSTQRVAAIDLTYRHPDRWDAHVVLGYPRRTRRAPRPVAKPVTPQQLNPFVPIPTITDTFDRPDAGALGTSDSGRVWVSDSGTSEILDEQGVFKTFGGNAKHLPGPWPVDFHMTLEVIRSTGDLLVNAIVHGHAGATAMQFEGLYGDSGTAGGPQLLVQALDGSATTLTALPLAGDIPTPFSFDLRVDAAGVYLECGGFSVQALYVDGNLHTLPSPTDMSGNLAFDFSNVDTTIDDLDVDGVPGVETANTPDEGQPVPRELIGTGDGATTVFNTTYPYAPSSLHPDVDGVIKAFTESDPTTGEVTFTVAPALGAEVSAWYQGGAP